MSSLPPQSLWGTWPFMQAHYRDSHGYTPERNSSSSSSSSPEPAQPRKKYNKHTPQKEDPPLFHTDETRMQQNRENANQSDTGISNIRAEHNERGRQMENPPPFHTHRVRTQAERKLIYQDDIGPTKTISAHTYRKSQITQLYKSTKAAQARLDDQAPTTSNGGMPTTTQRLGSLNFPPINPRNATKAYHKEKEAPPTEVVTLEVEDITTDVQRDEQIIITTSDNHKTNQNTEPHRSSTENIRDAHINLFCETRDQYRGQSAANTLVTSTLTSNPGEPQTIFTSESPKANKDHEPCKTADHHVPRRIGEQVHPTSRPMTSKYTEYGVQPPQKEPYDMDDRSVRAEVGAMADAKR